MSGNEVKIRMIRAHKIIRRWRTNDFHWKRSMASHRISISAGAARGRPRPNAGGRKRLEIAQRINLDTAPFPKACQRWRAHVKE